MKRLKRLLRRPKEPEAPPQHQEHITEQIMEPPTTSTADQLSAPNPEIVPLAESQTIIDNENSPQLPASYGAFEYTPVKDRRNFRLLRLKRRPDEFQMKYTTLTLEGSLVEVSLDSPPEYFALSYTWGEPLMSEDLIIDGKLLKITMNCASALRRMLRGKEERTLWVDSVCINQSNDPAALEERGMQVAMMDQIYRSAIQVNVHLGDGDAASDVACQTLKNLAQAYLGIKTPGPQQEASRAEYERLADDALATPPDYPYGKLYGVFCLPWFRRAWVVQEVAAGKKVFFYCGEYLLHFWTMVIGADFSRLPYSKLDLASNHWKAYLDFHHALQEFIRRREEGEPTSNFGLTMSSLLLAPAMLLDATRPEDKIYSLYGICKRLGFTLPTPDYRKPLAVVFTEAARAILHHDNNLDFLSSVEGSSGSSFGLPSWVPDFSGSMRQWSPSKPPHMTSVLRENANVSGNSRCSYKFQPDGRGLKIRGRRVDRICAVGEPWRIDNSTNLLGGSWRQTGQYAGGLVDCISSWFDVIQSRTESGDEKAIIQDMMRVLTGGSSSGKLPVQPAEEVTRYLSVLVECSRANHTARRAFLVHPNDHASEVLQVGDYFMSDGMRKTIHQLWGTLWKTVFRTTRDNLGTGSHSAKLGDHVVIFHGCKSPSIIRSCPGGYSYVSTACVDGIMEGEFWNAGHDVDDEWFVLI